MRLVKAMQKRGGKAFRVLRSAEATWIRCTPKFRATRRK